MDLDLLTGELTERESLYITRQSLLFSPKSFSECVRSIQGLPVTILSQQQHRLDIMVLKLNIKLAVPVLSYKAR